MSLIGVLNQPYPFTIEVSRRIQQIVIVGLSIFIFFAVFKPFGLSNIPIGEVLKVSAYYGVVTIVIGLFNNLVLPFVLSKYFNEHSWTLKKNILLGLWNLFSYTTGISSSSYIFSDSPHFTIEGYGMLLMYTLILGVSISSIASIVNQNYLLKKHHKIAEALNRNLSDASRPASEDQLEFMINRHKNIRFPALKLYFVEAVGNYISIVYENDGVKKATIRETIGSIEKRTCTSGNFFRTHRSYIVNIRRIEKIVGDSQGLKIHLKGIGTAVPVSRSRIRKFRELFSENI